jgi:hypothetical protein
MRLSARNICETKDSGFVLPLNWSCFFNPVTCHGEVTICVACLPGIAHQTDFTSDSQALETMRKEYIEWKYTYIELSLQSAKVILEHVHDLCSSCLSTWNCYVFCCTRRNIYHFLKFGVLKSLYQLWNGVRIVSDRNNYKIKLNQIIYLVSVMNWVRHSAD